jgi:hypothetical protein
MLVAATTIAACVLVAGAWRALSGERSNDVLLVHSWITHWLAGHANPYTDLRAVNYPPHAFIVLSWLGLLPKAMVPIVWTALNVATAPLVAWLFVSSVPLAHRERLLLAAMLTSWGAVLSGLWMGQFTLFSMALGLLAMRSVDRPVLSGTLLACALIKPHVAIVFAFWAVCGRRWRVLGVATGVIALGLCGMAAWARLWPTEVVESWLAVLVWQFGGLQPSVGSTAAWTLFVPILSDDPAGYLRTAGLVAGAGALLWTLYSRRAGSRCGCLPLAVASVVSLATLFHRRYDMILLAPAFVALWVVARQGGHARRWLLGVLLAMHLALVIEVPWAWQVWAGPAVQPASAGGWMAVHFDRFLVLGVGVLVFAFRNQIDLLCGPKERLP